MADQTAGARRPSEQTHACENCDDGSPAAGNLHYLGLCLCHCHRATPSYGDRLLLCWEQVRLLLDRRVAQGAVRIRDYAVTLRAADAWTTSPPKASGEVETSDRTMLIRDLDAIAKTNPA